jgi:hypothetical protein
MKSLSRIRLTLLSLYLVAGSGTLLSATLVRAADPITRPACDQCDQADRFVRLQQVTGGTGATSSHLRTHPVVLRPEEWTSVLSTLQVKRRAEGLLFRDPPGSVVPVFTPEEIRDLSTTLSKAFAEARPDECVVFGLSRLNDVNMTELTTGGWFLEGPSLHIVLANYRKVVTMPGTRQLLWERPLRPDAGPHYDLVAGPHQTVVHESAAFRKLLSPPPSELSIDYQAILLEEPGDVSPPQLEHQFSSDRARPPLSLEERLRALKRLHEQGLITEDEYRAKKQQLLDQF